MERKLLYLINPISGTKRKSLLKKTIELRTKEKRLAFEIGETRSDGDYSSLKNKIVDEKYAGFINKLK